jgi:vacuolar-type H+-ATPase subunit H
MEKNKENRLSPLDQIRHAEAEVLRRIAASRVEADKTIADAREHAAEELRIAQESGRREGEAINKRILLGASEEAEAIVLQAHNLALNITHRGRKQIEFAVQLAVNLVTGHNKETHVK